MDLITLFICVHSNSGRTITSVSVNSEACFICMLHINYWCKPTRCKHHYTLHTQEEGGLAHGLEAAAAVLVDCSVTRCQDDQHPVIGELLASCHWSL